MKIKQCCVLMMLIVLSLTGCGLKGPLYMPDNKTTVDSQTQPVTEPSSAAE